MKKIYLLLTVYCLLNPVLSSAQNPYYFPPSFGNTWETISPEDAGFCTDSINNLYTFLEEKNTKAFIVLKDGKIAMEQYFGTFEQDSAWYWASSGKTITGFLVGVAQEEGLLNIDDKTSDYLGEGWTSLPLEKENLITIRHQLSMTTGLDDGVSDSNCMDPDCLQYSADAGERWSYHNAPYRLLMDVIEDASGMTFNQYTSQKLLTKIGMGGTWINRVFFSKPRNMARFGSLIINDGNWDGTQVLGDQTFINDMRNTTNDFNKSYGYLWWLNGKESHMLPTTQFLFDEEMIPSAPDDVYAALGKNDQKLYIYPSKNIVVVRMGNSSGNSALAVSSFDNELWGKLSNIFCETTSTENIFNEKINIFPNPVNKLAPAVQIQGLENHQDISFKIFNTLGQEVQVGTLTNNEINVSNLSTGTFVIQFFNSKNNSITIQKFQKR